MVLNAFRFRALFDLLTFFYFSLTDDSIVDKKKPMSGIQKPGFYSHGMTNLNQPVAIMSIFWIYLNSWVPIFVDMLLRGFAKVCILPDRKFLPH